MVALALLRVFLLAFLLAIVTAGRATQDGPNKRLVSSPLQLHSALRDAGVSEIGLVAGGAWNFSAEEWGSPVTLHRPVVLEGVAADGSPHPTYLDMNRLTELVVVGAGGALHQRGLVLDDCLLPVMPLLCFAAGREGGNITLEGLVLGDASCAAIALSTATDWLLKSAYWATWQSSWTTVDERSIHVEDTGEIRGMPHGVVWRVVNSTFRCTGNETHALPGAAGDAGIGEAQVMAATMAVLLAVLSIAYYAVNRNVVHVHANESAEVVVARSCGIVLQALIGQGTFGRVFRGQYRGETVAVKVVDFPLFNKQAAAEVSRECQHALSCVHPSIVRCLTFHTVTVRTHLRRGVPLRETGYAHERDLASSQHEQHEQHEQQQPLGDHQPGANGSGPSRPPPSVATGSLPHDGSGASSASGLQVAGGLRASASAPAGGGRPAAGATLSTASTGAEEGGAGTMEGFMTLLVMDYCSLGNLHRAIRAGRFFLDRRRQQPNLDWVCRTALDIARGLQHLHDARSIVHRDVSTNNVLLAPDPSDPRGFRALLSDFGLSTVLVEHNTHKSSQLKGTVDFMPPEIFTSGEIRFSVDCYGLGVIIYWMCKGEGPYPALAPFQVVGKKLEEIHKKTRLLLPPCMPPDLRRLVWDCTNWDPAQRPTAAEAARRLQDITDKLSEEGHDAS